MGTVNGLDLFSGIGGLALALEPWVRPVAYCEIDPYCQHVLEERMQDGRIARAPVWDDVRTFDAGRWSGCVDIIYGGFPCQDISVAGRGAGLEGERSGLFFEVMRLAKEIQPAFVFLENVPAIRTRGLDVVVRALADAGYDCRWGALSAFDVGAPHKRERWFLLAHADRIDLRDVRRGRGGAHREGAGEPGDDGQDGHVGDSDGSRLEVGQGIGSDARQKLAAPFGTNWWAIEPGMGRVADGVSARVDRLKGLGNSVVPAQAREAFRRLLG